MFDNNFQGEKGAKGDAGPMGLPVSTKPNDTQITNNFLLIISYLFNLANISFNNSSSV